VAEHHPAAAATPATGHILLAEDNAMNVKLAACS
jgi:hypothetical protein